MIRNTLSTKRNSANIMNMVYRGVLALLLLMNCEKSALSMPLSTDFDTQQDKITEGYDTVHGRILAINMATLGKRRLQLDTKDKNAFANIEKVNDGQHLNLYQGDIQLDEELEEYLHMPIRTRTKRNALRTKKRLWTSRIIPYKVPSYMSHIRNNLRKAIAEFHKHTCLKFVPYRPGFHKNYILFNQKDGCSSKVGKRYYSPGPQGLSLANPCNNVPTILHELMHAAGFFHEQSRSDRDKYVRINWENILDGFSDQFDKYSWRTLDNLGQSYDYRSIMHYDRMAFTKNGKPTIVAIGNPGEMDQKNFQFSAGDIIEINALYNCKAKQYGWSSWSGFTPCDDKCYKSRERFCYNPGNLKHCGGKTNVYGIEKDRRKCTERECDGHLSVHGHWGRWSDWTPCTVTCDNGVKTRFRKCDNPKPGKYGKPCAGKENESGVCTVRRCHFGYDDTDFDDPVRPLGMWKNKYGAQLKWRTHKRYTQTIATGPAMDHTTGLGYYLYMESSGPAQRNYKAILTSPSLTTIRGGQCLKFAYSMYGRTTGSLEIKLKHPKRHERLFYKYGDQGNKWHTATITLNYPNLSGFTLEIIATVGQPGYSDIAIDDVFIDDGLCSCQDKYVKCSKWSKEGECQKNRRWMSDHCKRSCNICTDCKDTDKIQCPRWAKQGQCSRNPDWMHKNCPKSCKICKDQTVTIIPDKDCKDKDDNQCPLWAKQGYCNKNKDWMHKNCPKSCKLCKGLPPVCKDNDKRCKDWAKSKQCNKTPLYMHVHCRKSCGLCRYEVY